MKAVLAFVSLFLPLAAPALRAQEPPAKDPGFEKIVQIAIVTRDIEASAKRWAALLGMPQSPITTTRPGQEVKVVYRGKPSSGQAKLTFFRTGQVVLELIEPVGGNTAWKEFLDQHGEGVQHIGIQVSDLEGSVRRIQQLGYPEIHRGRYDKDNGTYVYFDTMKQLGTVVELLHSDPKR
jgi:catechol 2,3-dioxygenase-like lactoylglutathione lyase family enzyme